MEIIERRLGYSNTDMLKHCEILKSVMSKSKEAKIGRGKTVQTIQIPKYKEDKAIVEKINNSLSHYAKNDFDFRDYQRDIIKRGVEIIQKHGFLYLAMEVRTGKTLTSLGIANEINAKVVLFITKKKAVTSIAADYKALSPDCDITIINYESLHTVQNDSKWDLIILDEAHCCFLGNTLIDGIKIKDIKLGYYLNSFNFEENRYEKKKVVNVFKNKLDENLVKIKCNGKEIVCTESHEIYTKRGWVKAKDILPSDDLQVV